MISTHVKYSLFNYEICILDIIDASSISVRSDLFGGTISLSHLELPLIS